MILDGVVLNRYHKELIMTNRKLRIESLEQRTLLAVLAGGSEQIAEFGSGPSAPTEAVTWVVNTTEDPTSWETGDDLLSLREAIGRAAAGDTITFDSALAAGTITLSGTQLGISTGITIDASGIGGMTIDGNGQSRVFVVDGSADECRVELTAITITGGNVTDSGGGIYNCYGVLTLTNCTVTGNTASYGGGIGNESGTLTLTDCAIAGNTAHYGGGIYDESGTTTLANCKVERNNASYYGGGIHNTGTLTLTNCIVTENSASRYGAGIYNADILTLTNCTVAGNTASKSGDGIYNGSMTSLYNSIVLGITNADGIYAYNTLSEFTDWTESAECLTYDSAKSLFADPENGNYTLAADSQAIDRGNNDYVTVETDLAGNPRIYNTIVDLGAYEYQGSLEPFMTPTISAGTPGVYVSYGANRHRITWDAIANVEDYELAHSADGGFTWSTVVTAETGAVVTRLSYGAEITYRVRALGNGAYADSDWSASKTFMVCPMDINGDGDISNSDRALLSPAWLSEEGDDHFRNYCDIDGDGEISNRDRMFLATNWLAESQNDDLVYPAPQAADAVFGEYISADLDIELDVF
jgi:hypothetical protein